MGFEYGNGQGMGVWLVTLFFSEAETDPHVKESPKTLWFTGWRTGGNPWILTSDDYLIPEEDLFLPYRGLSVIIDQITKKQFT